MKTYSVEELVRLSGATLLCGEVTRAATKFSFSSKECDEDTVFLPIVGERVDAHDFIGDAYARGCRITFTERGAVEPQTEGMVYLAVDSTVGAWQRLGAAIRKEASAVPIVSITGSVGKTTTKELVATTLTPMGTVLKTVGNKNGQLGVPHMMQMLSEKPDVAVIEMGMSLFGEMARIAPVVAPNYAIITNIGVSHIGNLGSKENIRKEKLSMLNNMQAPGVVLLNGDDALLRELCEVGRGQRSPEEIAMYDETRSKLSELTLLSYGQAEWCDYRFERVRLHPDSSEFLFCYKEMRVFIRLPVPGLHNVANAVAALAVAHRLGIAITDAAKVLENYHPMSMRGAVEQLPRGIWLIDDTYNASPDSMRSGLAILAGTVAKRRIAMLADILELGEQSESCHRQVGAYVAECPVDVLITVGTEARAIAAEAAKKEGLWIMSFATKEAGLKCLLSIVKDGDAILMKGSRGMGLEYAAAALRDVLKTIK